VADQLQGDGSTIDRVLNKRPLTHRYLRAGGQKVKVVLAAAMWNCPHLLVLDEPTNYLDRDSLGALAEGIRTFDGGVIMISHNAGAPPNTKFPVAHTPCKPYLRSKISSRLCKGNQLLHCSPSTPHRTS